MYIQSFLSLISYLGIFVKAILWNVNENSYAHVTMIDNIYRVLTMYQAVY